MRPFFWRVRGLSVGGYYSQSGNFVRRFRHSLCHQLAVVTDEDDKSLMEKTTHEYVKVLQVPGPLCQENWRHFTSPWTFGNKLLLTRLWSFKLHFLIGKWYKHQSFLPGSWYLLQNRLKLICSKRDTWLISCQVWKLVTWEINKKCVGLNATNL